MADGAVRPCVTSQPTKIVRGKEIRQMSLKINIRATADATILDMSGRVSIGDALAELRDSIREALAGDQKNILLNLAEVSYIDSSGLGQLIGSYATVTSRGGQMKLLNLQKRVHDLMQITKLVIVFETYANEEAALKSFAKKKETRAAML
jgi:anti-sigma B factor antagonist